MTYIYQAINKLVGKGYYGDGNCALMVQYYAKLPRSDQWRQGPRVVEQASLWPGIAIATFFNGRYPNHPHNNHIAFFLKFGRRSADNKTWETFFIVEQFKPHAGNPGSGGIIKREIKAQGKVDPKYGDQWVNPSNNADAFYIIE